ncbi:MAG: hypothetical protein NVS4B7_14450 [Ktedonobacteraceae bacterium]
MSTHERSEKSTLSQRDNSYFTNPESGAEMARVMDQDHLLTKAMNGLFSERSTLSGIHRVLDIGCGPGGWDLDVSFTYPEIEVVGIDISEQAIDYARAQARVKGLENVRFLTMDATKPLDFPNASFDMVNARTIGFLPTGVWPNLMRECMRVLRSGGVIRLTESEWSFSNSPGLEGITAIFCRALKAAGQSFSPDGRRHGITTMLAGFLRDVGCINVQQVPYVIDFSAGMEAHASVCKNWKVVYKLSQPFFIKTGVATQEEIDPLYEQMLIEMMQDDFRGIMYLLTAWGEKP